ncbi:MAG: hypothetical protein L0Y58_01740 [Verrucomicrobia subdivision 3 bacterium]|nr:hypothetical protein [Limisphaerales bacterium]
MGRPRICFLSLAALLLTVSLFSGCESTDSGSVSSSTAVYYGATLYDPWYHGDYDHDHDVIVTPPPGNRPGGDFGPRPEHPIARPPGDSRPPSASQLPAPRPSVRPMPSIPSTPRVAARGGRGR